MIELKGRFVKTSRSYLNRITAGELQHQRTMVKVIAAEGDTAQNASFRLKLTECGWRKGWDGAWVEPTAEFLAESRRGQKVELREDDRQQFKATCHALAARNFTTASDTSDSKWKRGAITVSVADDGSWECGKKSGKDSKHLQTFLDTEFPESFRHRLTEAFKCLGLSEKEAQFASNENEEYSHLLNAWKIVHQEAAEYAKGERTIHPRHQQLMNEVLGKK